jgi:hypothetical protein
LIIDRPIFRSSTDVEQAFEPVLELDEHTEVGDLHHRAADDVAHAVLARDLVLPRIRLRVASRRGDALLLAVDFESTTARTVSPFLSISFGCVTFLVHDMSETWSRPSMPGSISTNAP